MEDKGAKLVSSAVLGLDGEAVVVGDRCYYIAPPTIKKICGAGRLFASYAGEETIGDYFRKLGDVGILARALSWFIAGDESLTEELMCGTLDEIVAALEAAVSLIKVENFLRLSVLTRSVLGVIARPKC